MKTLDQMVQEQTGKFVEVAGSSNALNQCVDLANLYIRDVLGLPIIEWTNAVDFPSKAGDKYDYFKNDPTAVPLKGDIIVWSGGVGHIAVVLEADVNSFTSFDQNYPVGSPCKQVKHTYKNVIGWLRAKKPQEDQQKIIDQLRDERDHNDRLYKDSQKELEQARKTLQEINVEYEGIKQELTSYKAIVRTYADLLGVGPTETEKIAGEIKKLIELEDQNSALLKDLSTTNDEYEQLQKTNEALKKDYYLVNQEKETSRQALDQCIADKKHKALTEYSKLERLLSLFR